MTRRFLTAEDVRRAGTKEIQVDPETVVTPQAMDVARAGGITIRTSSGPYVEPVPDRGPDAVESSVHLPAMPEPAGDLAGTGVIVTCVGRNRPGVLAEVTSEIASTNANIQDVSQKMVGEYFHMVLVVELGAPQEFAGLKERLDCLSDRNDYVVRIMHERVFRFMHRI